MRILIAEDNENSRVLLRTALLASGYEVDCAENGAVALDLATKKTPDLIISDILMPEMDGYALCRAVRNHKQLRTVPFIFYTATYTDPKDEKLAMDLGATRFIVKPMEIDLFLQEINHVLENHQKERVSAPEKNVIGGEEFQKNYAEVLANKLNQKIQQLEEEKKKLAKSEHRYRSLVEVLRENYFFYTYDPKGVYSYVSPSIENVLGYSQEEFLVHYTHYLTDNDINDKARQYTEMNLAGEATPSFELEMYHKDGTTHRFEVSEEPILNKGGEVLAIEGIAHDITKRIFAEEQLVKAQEKLQQSQKMEAIGTLAGGIAHDFNNILTPIIGFTEMTMLDMPEESKNWENLTEVLEAANRAKLLAKQILTFSRHAEEEKKPISFQTIVKEALKLLRASIPTTIEIRESINPDCQALSANPTQMHQIIMNLCTNAYYAMREKTGLLAVSLDEINITPNNYIAGLDLLPGTYLKLEVSDTGIGIEPDKLAKIFEPYYTTKPIDKGTGLGLSVVHGIIQSHGGHISVYSEPGKGTTFHIYLPALTKNQPQNQHIQESVIPGGTEHVLLVDDDPTVGKLEKEQLEELGYQVTNLTNSVDALALFSQEPHTFDLVITDMTMPKMTGADLTQEILKIKPDTPVILCTGYSELIDRDKAFTIGIREYLMKPVSRHDLARAVRKVIDAA